MGSLRSFRWSGLALLAALGLLVLPAKAAEKPNLLIVTVDDMSCDSVGVYGCPLEGTTPNMDRLARQSLRFEHAHVQVGNCMPSRNVMWSGLYPHNNRVEGFYQVRDAKHPHLADLMRKAGYFTAIRHKISHSTPYSPYDWDLELDTSLDGGRLHIKSASSYGESASRGIAAAREAGKPFCLMINISDPHKPFYKPGTKDGKPLDPHVPSRIYDAGEVPVPGFLFDDPVVREELALYYSSVRRADDCLGAVLEALEQSGTAPETVVLFLSDHGMPLPFAKTQLYHHSTRTPLMVRWPGVTEPGAIDRQHMVSAVDLLPTLLEVIEAEAPPMDGRSFAPLLRGESQDGRDAVYKVYNENAGASRDPMRGIQTRQHLYLFNPWSNGERVMATATTGTQTYRRMALLAPAVPALAARLELYRHRVVEELYDVQRDPDCLHNLIDDPAHQEALGELRSQLEAMMVKTGDHMLDTFRKRDDAEAREAYVRAAEQEAEARRAQRRNPNRKRNAPAAKGAAKRPDRGAQLIRLKLPPAAAAGKPLSVLIQHTLPAELGKQAITVTLKAGDDGKRVERKVVEAAGRGELEVIFTLPDEVPDQQVRVAAFVGRDYQSTPQHLQTPPLKVTDP